jgi:ABC-type phosphonate transport system ATPase subunit
MEADRDTPLLVARGLTKQYGARMGCEAVTLDLYEGEVLAVGQVDFAATPISTNVPDMRWRSVPNARWTDARPRHAERR